MASKQKRKSKNDTKIDFDSFSDTEKELNKYYAGMARIIDCELITDIDNLPESYLYNYNNITYDKYLIIDAEKNESIIKIVVPVSRKNKKGDLDYCFEWTGANTIDYLAGKRVPVKHIKNDVFRLEKFDTAVLKFLPLSIVQKLIKKNIIKQQIYGNWTMGSHYSILLYAALITPIFTFSIILSQYFSNSFLLLLLPYVSFKILAKIYER